MKCPVCDQENPSMLCPRCGFDASRDYEKYPTLGVIPSVSALRRQWQGQSDAPASTESPRKKSQWLSIAACAIMLAVGLAAGFFLGKGAPAPTEPEISVQTPPETTEPEISVQTPPETTEPAPLQNLWEANVLRNDLASISEPSDAHKYSVFGSGYIREQIDTIVFLGTLRSAPAAAWDASANGNGSVLAWVSSVGGRYWLYLAGEGGINAGATCRNLFAGYTNLNRINFAGNLHTDFSQDMGYMFYDCGALTSLDLSDFNTANVRDMRGMFYDCDGLSSLDLRSFSTDKVQNMSYMFWRCDSLKSMDLSSFDTTNVQDMRSMFEYCDALTSLDLSSFNTTNVRDTTDMFYDCPAGSDWEHILK